MLFGFIELKTMYCDEEVATRRVVHGEGSKTCASRSSAYFQVVCNVEIEETKLE